MDVLKEGRLRRIWFNEGFVLDITAAMTQGWPDYFGVPTIKGLPKDVQVVSVHHNPMNRTFEFTIASSKFTPVQPGDLIPMWDGSMGLQFESVDIPKHLRKSPVAAYWGEGTNPDPIIKKDLLSAAEAIRKAVESDPDPVTHIEVNVDEVAEKMWPDKWLTDAMAGKPVEDEPLIR